MTKDLRRAAIVACDSKTDGYRPNRKLSVVNRFLRLLLRPSLRAFKRDLADRHFVVIGAAIIIAVASVTAVDMFTDRVRTALERQSSALLAADLVVISNSELPSRYNTLATSLELDLSQTLSMRSVVTFADNLQLAELKVVTAGYPLRGEMLIADEIFADPLPTTAIPAPGKAWVEGRLLSLIEATVGDRIQIGKSEFEISKILVLEPDRGGDLFNIAPRVMVNQSDIDQTGLIVPGSRVRYSLLVAGEQTRVTQYSEQLQLRDGDRSLSPANARPEIRVAMRRAEHYLGLAAFTTIILACVAIALAAASFAHNHQDTVALLRTLGATRRYVLAYFSIEIALLGAITAAIGALLGAGCQELIAQSMTGWTQTGLPPATAAPAVRAAIMAMAALAGFALPPLMNLRNVPPLRVLRSDADAKSTNKITLALYALTTSIFLAPWREGDIAISLWSLVGLGACLVVLVLAAFVAIKILTRIPNRNSIVWRFGVANVARRGSLTIVQIAALGLGLTALLVLGIVRNNLLESWITSLPHDAPNQFLINIQPRDVTSIESFFARHDLDAPAFHPMIRGRLIAINDMPVSPEHYTDPRARRLAEREFNLSWAELPKPYNKIVAGKWWDPAASRGEFSVEADIAKTLGLSLDDTLTYRVAEHDVHGLITNFRSVQWDSMQVNFFVEAPKALLEDLPATFITSFHLDAGNYPVMRDLVREFPSVTVIDVAALFDHVRTIMDRSATTIEFVFVFTLLAGILVLIAAIQTTQDERVFEAALLKTFGASRALTLRIISSEFLTIGFITGAIAGGLALVIGWIVATQILEIEYIPTIWTIIAGLLAGIVGVSVVGASAILNAVRHPSAIVLRYRN
jgi:putative ABC transport system permease protein